MAKTFAVKKPRPAAKPKRPAARGNAARLMKSSAELGLAVPQVVGHRMARMAMAGPVLSARDRKEFEGMVAEKGQAFAQGWQAMATQAFKAQQALASSWLSAWWKGALRGKPSTQTLGSMARQQGQASLGVMQAGLKPVHQKAVANAKRLARTKLK